MVGMPHQAEHSFAISLQVSMDAPAVLKRILCSLQILSDQLIPVACWIATEPRHGIAVESLEIFRGQVDSPTLRVLKKVSQNIGHLKSIAAIDC
jgi:hypothetical protein